MFYHKQHYVDFMGWYIGAYALVMMQIELVFLNLCGNLKLILNWRT